MPKIIVLDLAKFFFEDLKRQKFLTAIEFLNPDFWNLDFSYPENVDASEIFMMVIPKNHVII